MIPAFYKFDSHHDASAAALRSAIESVSETIVGSAAYDALIAQCAIKAQADVLLTWNTRDFARFGPGIAPLVKTPTEL